MRIGILQPGYLPWLGFFEQIYKSDVFVIYDDVQYDKEGWRNRNRIKTANGPQWLTVPVLLKSEKFPIINKVTINNTTDWKKKHLLSIRYSYAKSKFFDDYISIFEEAYSKDWGLLIDVDMYFIYRMLECFGLGGKKIVMASSLDVTGDRDERLINICKKFNADTFYEGAAGRNYIKEEDFAKHNIKVEFQDYKHPAYDQLYGEFIPYLSAVDLLFNHGPGSLSVIIQQERDQKET
ncbi:MAG: WbqC family protein [Candidatus Omnitrophica bacterium]|nr:WbqC family protein [Candidatus Omnitrophota bacterium]